jgi:hypothetical protein
MKCNNTIKNQKCGKPARYRVEATDGVVCPDCRRLIERRSVFATFKPIR